jgi:hypothetical protein
MANIKVKDLTTIAGVDLFNDSESFMRDLSDGELNQTQGGSPWTAVLLAMTVWSAL